MKYCDRLHAVLVDSFDEDAVWTIDAMKLSAMINMPEKYPSFVVRKIETAVNRINRDTSLDISLDVKRPRHGKAILTFQKR